jgi:hypothetical protein
MIEMLKEIVATGLYYFICYLLTLLICLGALLLLFTIFNFKKIWKHQ